MILSYVSMQIDSWISIQIPPGLRIDEFRREMLTILPMIREPAIQVPEADGVHRE